MTNDGAMKNLTAKTPRAPRPEVDVHDADQADVLRLAARMRDIDRREIWEMAEMRPYDAAVYSVASSRYSRAIYVNGEICCIYGVGTDEDDDSLGVPWMLSTDELAKYPRLIVSLGREAVAEMKELYIALANYVHVDNAVAIRWLEWLGFDVEEADERDSRGENFRFFWTRKSPERILAANSHESREACDTNTRNCFATDYTDETD